MVFTVRLQDEVDEATLSYRFKFGQGYEWTWGGKLPGLADEDMASGCRSSDVTGTGSFVSRTMWRAGGEILHCLDSSYIHTYSLSSVAIQSSGIKVCPLKLAHQHLLRTSEHFVQVSL